jgi:mannose-6-phosphate isomerase-like protein (cupin superfamily)
MTIPNSKIERLRPEGALFERWKPADVRGGSLLYDPPGDSFAERDGCPVLNCDLTDPRIALYAGLAQAVELMDTVLSDLRPCWLDPASYHSTYRNSVNVFNLNQIRLPQHREGLAEFLRSLPKSVAGAWPEGLPPRRVLTDSPWRIRFRFKKLHVWPKAFALVALLEPADEASAWVLAMLNQKGAAANEKLVEMGLAAETGPPPHVTLAYFPTAGEASAAMERIGECTKVLPPELGDLTVEHSSISLYGWTSMVDFWPAVRFKKWGNTAAYAAQSEIMKRALAEPDHSLDSLLHWMRHSRQAKVYLSGRRVDNDSCFGSDDVGVLLSVLPEDGEKAGVPGYHPGSAEVYATFQGSLLMDCLEGGQVASRTVSASEVLVLPPGQCHRVSAAAKSHAASMIVKTNLKHEPGVVRCEACQYFPDRATCPLHKNWMAEATSVLLPNLADEGASGKENQNGTL